MTGPASGSPIGTTGTPVAGAPVAGALVRSLSCPSCGAPIALHAAGWTQTVACASCGSVLDAADPNLRVLREARRRHRFEPLIPLGTRGTLPGWGAPHEVIGVQERAIRVEGTTYAWREYLCFNPYRGFRYLTEYDGHWTDVVPVSALLSEDDRRATQPTVAFDGAVFRHFQSAQARTTHVLGEFPWQVRADDLVRVRDYVAPPRILSVEEERDETTWSVGTYVDGDAVWAGFALPGRAPAATGVYAAQPNAWAPRATAMWGWFAIFAGIAIALVLARVVTASNAEVFGGRYFYAPERGSEQAFVTPSFSLDGRRANVRIETQAELDDQWMYVDYALVNETTGEVFGVGRELGYFDGWDADGSWSEGARSDAVTLGPVPGGRYFLRIEPSGGDMGRPLVGWRVRVRRDTASVGWLLVSLLVLVVPPFGAQLLAAGFETRRWAESDHAPVTTGGDDEDEE